MNKDLMLAYTEVDKIISIMDDTYIEKIPKKLRDLIHENKMDDYEVNIDFNKSLKKQNISKKALAILAVLNYNYWCEDEEEKNELIKLYEKNEICKQKELREKYNPEDIFKNKKSSIDSKNNQLVEYNPKEKIFIKIINKIKKLLNLT